MIGHVAREESAAVARDDTGVERAEVLQQIRHALERTVGQAGADGRAGVVVHARHDRVDGGITPVDALERRRQDFLGRGFLRSDQLGQAEPVVPLELLGEPAHAETFAPPNTGLSVVSTSASAPSVGSRSEKFCAPSMSFSQISRGNS